MVWKRNYLPIWLVEIDMRLLNAQRQTVLKDLKSTEKIQYHWCFWINFIEMALVEISVLILSKMLRINRHSFQILIANRYHIIVLLINGGVNTFYGLLFKGIEALWHSFTHSPHSDSPASSHFALTQGQIETPSKWIEIWYIVAAIKSIRNIHGGVKDVVADLLNPHSFPKAFLLPLFN